LVSQNKTFDALMLTFKPSVLYELGIVVADGWPFSLHSILTALISMQGIFALRMFALWQNRPTIVIPISVLLCALVVLCFVSGRYHLKSLKCRLFDPISHDGSETYLDQMWSSLRYTSQAAFIQNRTTPENNCSLVLSWSWKEVSRA
jgi:hypothetical protein